MEKDELLCRVRGFLEEIPPECNIDDLCSQFVLQLEMEIDEEE
jgi:hypothetical protein